MKYFQKIPPSKSQPVRTNFIILLALVFTILFPNLVPAAVTDGAQRFRLDNGLTVILKEDHSSPIVAIQMWVKTGSANETEEEAGITHLIEHMIFKGTTTRKTGEIARTIEASGGHINAYTSYDRTVYLVEIASSHFDTALDVLLDAVQHSLFDPSELEREKEVVLEEYRRSLDIPQRRLGWTMMNLCYQKHPYRRPIIGYESTIRSFDRKAILKYMDKWYTPENMVLVAVGDLNTGHALKTIKALIKDMPRRKKQEPSRPVEPEQTSLRKIVLDEAVQQIYLDMSWHIPSITHSNLPALDLMEIGLGHGKTSRLYNRLKMKANLVHSIGAGSYSLADPSLFSIHATLSPDKLNSALDAIVGEINRIILEPINESELSKTKTIAEADYIYGMETMSGQAGTLGFFETMFGDMYQTDEYLERLNRVTSNDITRVANNYLKPENLSIGLLVPKGSNITLSTQKIIDLFSQTRLRKPLKAKNPLIEDNGITLVTLPNGIRLIVKEDHRLPVVSIRVAFLGGTRLENPKSCGISAFVTSMLTRGTKEKTAAEIALTVDSWGGDLSGFSGNNSFGISARFLSKVIYPGLELLADVLMNPTFPESEIKKVRQDMLATIKSKKDHPTPQLFDLFYKTLFRYHPYGHPQTGTIKSIKSINRSDLIEWYNTLAVSSNFVVAVVGDVNKDQLIPYIKILFEKFRTSSQGLPKILPEPPLTKIREAHIQRPGAQTHLAIGYLGADLKSSNNAPMTLIKTSLSGQGGRLFYELRDKESLAYTIHAFRRPGLETGVFGIYLACDPKKLASAKNAILEQLDKVRRDGLTKKELEAAKKYLLGNMEIDLQTNGTQAMHMCLDELYGLGYDHIQQFIKDIKSVTLEEINRAARKIIVPEKYVFVTVGPDKTRENDN